MHVESVPNRGSHPTILLRQSYREGKRVRKRTLANLTCLPPEAIETLKRALRGEKLVPADHAFAIERSIPHGHVKAVLGTIRKLVENQALQLSLFDERDLAEIRSDEFPGERLVACFNPLLADERARKRQALLLATEEKLQRIAREVARRTKTPLLTDQIALKVGRVINRHKVGKHVSLHIEDGVFRWERNEASIEQEAALDGIYVIRTSEPKKRLSAENTVRSYKNLGQVEQVFRCFKGIDIRVRPIYHSRDPRVRAHVFLCLLAYYVEWHMRRVLGSVLFGDEELTANRKTRDPVAKAQPSASVRRKKAQRTTCDGLGVHSFSSLLEDLGTLCRNRCRILADPSGNTFTQNTQPTPLHARVFQLLGV